MQTTTVADVPVEDLVKVKLGSAQIAYLSGRLIDPRGDNALEYYKAVLALQPDNAEAKAGTQKVIDTLEQRVVKSLQERKPARVVTAWTALQRAAPDHPQLEPLRTQLLALSRAAPKVTNAPRSTASPARRTAVRTAEDAQAERELAEAIARELAEQEAAASAPIEQPTGEAPAQQEPLPTEEVAPPAEAASLPSRHNQTSPSANYGATSGSRNAGRFTAYRSAAVRGASPCSFSLSSKRRPSHQPSTPQSRRDADA